MSTKVDLAELPVPCLALVTDHARYRDQQIEEVVSAAVHGGVNLVQLRIPPTAADDWTSETICQVALKLRRTTEGSALFFVNGYPEIATRVNADGVHLAEARDSITRESLPKGLMVGRSVHSLEAVYRAERAGSNMLIAGTMFPTSSHLGKSTSGPELITQLRQSTKTPIIGIGGITPSNASLVMKAGADGIAVIGSIFDSDNPELAARELRSVISQDSQSQ